MCRDRSAGEPVNRRDSIPCSASPVCNIRNANAGGEDNTTAPRMSLSQSTHRYNQSEPQTCDHAARSIPAKQSLTTGSDMALELSEQEMLYEIYNYILELVDLDGVDTSFSFERAELYPPITAQSLAELDMHRIINNPRLRHDVNFDRDLHFRPNLDGSKGHQKTLAANEYWRALEAEFFMYSLSALRRAEATDARTITYWENIMQCSQRRLPKMFEVIRDILKTLVPDHEREMVATRLDVNLIMQQISNGICDLEALSSWLASLLQAHCAPMRDGVIRLMREELFAGARESNEKKLVTGLRRLMNILEMMRLDVANYQIRQMRPWLLHDSIDFQRRYNTHRISIGGKIDVLTAQIWFNEEVEVLSAIHVPSTPVQTLASALLRDLLFNENNTYPQTFYLDLDRLRMMRINLQTQIFLSICSGILTDLAAPDTEPFNLSKAQTQMRTAMLAIVGSYGMFYDRLENIAVEIIRASFSIENRPWVFDEDLTSFVTSRLQGELGMTSPTFDMHAWALFDRLLPKLQGSVQAHFRMSALQLQDALLPRPPARGPPPTGFGAVCTLASSPMSSTDVDADIIRRMTHVVCLHWHIWSDLVYLVPLDDIAMQGNVSSNHSRLEKHDMEAAPSPTDSDVNFLSTSLPSSENVSKPPAPTASAHSAQSSSSTADREEVAAEQASVDSQPPTMS